MKGITGKKYITLARRVDICKSYNGMDKGMMSKVTMCKSTELQEALAQTKGLCGGKKVVATTVIETKIVKKKRVLAQQGISKDFTLPKYKAERGNYESAFLKASGADTADSTVNYKQVAAKKNVRRRLAEGTSIARWSLAFDKDDKADAAAAVVSSERFSAAVAKESGVEVQKAMAKVAIVDVKVEVKTVKYVLVDAAGSGGKRAAKPNASLCAIAEKQLGALLKVDLSKASQLPKKELHNLCGVFAVFPEEQRKQFSLCSAKLKAAIETAPKLCPKKPSTTKKPVGTKKPGSGGKPGGSASGLRILSDKACITLGAKGDTSICRVGPNEVDISGDVIINGKSIKKFMERLESFMKHVGNK